MCETRRQEDDSYRSLRDLRKPVRLRLPQGVGDDLLHDARQRCSTEGVLMDPPATVGLGPQVERAVVRHDRPENHQLQPEMRERVAD